MEILCQSLNYLVLFVYLLLFADSQFKHLVIDVINAVYENLDVIVYCQRQTVLVVSNQLVDISDERLFRFVCHPDFGLLLFTEFVKSLLNVKKYFVLQVFYLWDRQNSVLSEAVSWPSFRQVNHVWSWEFWHLACGTSLMVWFKDVAELIEIVSLANLDKRVD